MTAELEKRTQNSVTTLMGVSNADGVTPLRLWVDDATHALLVSAAVTIAGGAVSQADNSAYVAGTTSVNPIGAFYHSSIDAVTDGRVAALAMDSKRNLFTVLRDAAGNARGANVDANNNLGIVLPAETTKVIGTVRNVGNGGASYDSTVGPGTAPTNQIVTGAIYNSTEISPTNGQAFAMQGDAKGRIRMVLMDAAGNTRGVNIDANNNLGAVLAAETTKVLGTVRMLGNVGAVVDGVITAATSPANGVMGLGVYNSTEPSPTTGQSVGIQLDSKGRQRMVLMDAAGNTRGANVDASNRMAVIADQNGSNWSINLVQINGVTISVNNGVVGTGVQRVAIASDNSAVAGLGAGATGAAVPANAIYQGVNPQTSLPTAATAGNLTGATADKYGRQVMLLGTIRDLRVTQTTTISASTSETTIGTAVASVFLDITLLVVSNTSAATNTRIDFRDTTAGSVLFSLQSNGGQPPVGFAIVGAIPQTTVNTNWTAQCATSTTDIRVYAVFEKNK